MVGAAYAYAGAVYNWFCRPRASTAPPGRNLGAIGGAWRGPSRLRFDSNVAALAVEVRAGADPDRGQDRRSGDRVLHRDQQSARATIGQAAYNWRRCGRVVFPEDQTASGFTTDMAAGEKREMPVVFYVDPKLAADSDNDGLNPITLSYTFYPVACRRAAGSWRAGQAQGKP